MSPPEPDPPPMWSPMADAPEMLAFAFLQEDAPVGPITSWQSRGLRPKLATGAATKLPGSGGVLFSGTQSLQWPVDTEAAVTHRWWVGIARTDAPGSSTAVPILTVHSASGGNAYRQPAMRFEMGQLQSSIRDAAAQGTIGAAVNTADFSKWHVVMGFHRGWEHRAWIDGVELPPRAFSTWMPPNTSTPSWLGAGAAGPGNPALPKALAIDCVIVGHGQLSDALLHKLVGWAHWRANRVDLLPASHPHKAAAPRPDGSEGAPDLYKHDQAAWSAWTAIPQAARTVNRGNPLPAAADYALVFRDDFLTNTVVDDLAGGPADLWYAPGYNSAVGGSAVLRAPGVAPNCYIHNPADGGTLTLRLQETTPGNNSWVTGTILTANRAGKGRQWGKGRFRIRCRFPQMAPPRPGFFPAWWGYDADYLVWRTRNRLEWDIFEYDGLNGLFLNHSMHVHPGRLPFNSPEISVPDLSHKMIGTTLTLANGFDPQIDIYDGQFHIWEGRVEDDFTYVLCDEHEVARMPTRPWLLRPRHHIISWAYRAQERAATPGHVYDMVIDWVEIWQRESDLAAVPAGFSARPTLSVADGVATLTPNTVGQLEVRWYAIGVPSVGASGPNHPALPGLRAHVRNLSLWHQPEAWTAVLV